MGITEWLANLPIHIVVIAIVVLLAVRFALIKRQARAAKAVAEIAESLAVAMGLVFLIIRPFIVQAFFIPSASMRPTLLERDHIMVNKFIYRFREPARGDVVVFLAPPEATDGTERDFIKRVVAVPGDIVRITPGYVTVGNEQIGHDRLRETLSSLRSKGRVRLVSSNSVLVDGGPVPLGAIARAEGHPGREVNVVPGQVLVNGKPIREPYVAEDPDAKYPGGPGAKVDPAPWTVMDRQRERAVRIPKGKLFMMGDNRNDSSDSRAWGLLDRSRVRGEAMFVFWPLSRIRWIQ